MDLPFNYIRRKKFKKVPSKRNSIVNNVKLNYTSDSGFKYYG